MNTAENWDAAWAEICRRWLPDDEVRPDDNYRQAYFTKWEIARQIKPRVIVEIGVRACYSALAMLFASPGARYIGIERDAGDYGGVRGITQRAAPVVLAEFDFQIRYQDSRNLTAFRVDDLNTPVDLFHIDGDHSWDGAWADMELAFPVSKWLLVDDYDFIRPVQAAVDHFAVMHRIRFPEIQIISDGGFRGSALIAGAMNPLLAPRTSSP